MTVELPIDDRRLGPAKGRWPSAARAGRTALAVALAALGLGVFASAAQADVEICAEGSAAGQCLDPEGVAADTSSGEEGSEQIYVAEAGNDRISVFDPSGGFLFAFGWGVEDGSEEFQTCTTETGCQAGIAGGGAGQIANPRSIAVDSVEGSPGLHRIYVYESSNRRVQAFAPDGSFLWLAGKEVNAGSGPANLCTNAGPPTDVCQAASAGTGPGEFTGTQNFVAVGPGGNVYASDMPKFEEEPRIQQLDPDGNFVEECEVEHEDRLNSGVAIDAAGEIYAAFNKGGGVFKFEADCSLAGAPYPLDEETQTTALAVDGEGNLLAGQRETKAKPGAIGSYRIITAYDPSGAKLARFGYGSLEGAIRGVAALGSESGDVLAAETGSGGDAVNYLTQPAPLAEPGPIPAPPGLAAPEEAITSTRATLEAEANPEGEETTYRFDYVDRASFEAEGFEGPNTRETPEESLGEGAEDFKLHFAEATVGCADPVSEAEEEGKCLEPDTEYVFRVLATNSEGDGEAQGSFTTKSAPELLATYATDPGTETMRLNVRLDPLGIPTTGYFEYVEQGSFEAGGFEGATQVPDVAGGQSPLDFGAGEGPVTRGATVFPLEHGTAYRYRFVAISPLIEPTPGPERAFVTFSPAQVEPGCPNAALRTGASATLPDCRAYELVSPVDKAGGDVVPLEDPTDHVPAALDQAALSGERLTYSGYRPFAEPEGAPFISQFLAERTAGGWANRGISPPRERPLLEPAGLLGIEFKAATADLCSFWLRSVYDPPLTEEAIERYPNLYRRDVSGPGCGPPGYTALTTNEPAHETTTNEAFPGEHYRSLELQGTSADGSKAIYAVTDNLTPAAPDLEGEDLAFYEWEEGEPLRYGCILPGEAPFEEACSGGQSHNAPGPNGRGLSNRLDGAISTDGSRVYWTAAGGNGTGEGPIYLRIEGTETLAVSAAAEAEEAESESEFVAAATDGSRALFATGGTLYEYRPAGEATSEIAPQYLGILGASEDASRVYVASRADLDGEGEAAAGEPNLYLHEAGSEPRFVATLAEADMPASFKPSPIDPQPFRQIARVSPSGRHAAFNSFAPLTGYDNTDAASGETDTEVFRYDAEAGGGAGELVCVSCNPSGARPAGADVGRVFGAEVAEYWAGAYLPGAESDLYAARALSEDGQRVFFQSSDKLSARDANGAQDLYQWEAPGAGGCDTSDPGYSPAAKGCIELVSSGQASHPAALVDASPSGDDVFFSTLASLVGEDHGLIDVYDARVGGGFAEAPPPPPECEGEACQPPAIAPPTLNPSSLLYSGPGNLAAPARPSRCARPARRARALSRRAKRLRGAAKRSRAPAARRKRSRAARRSARKARRLSRSAKRCRARARAARGGAR